MSRKCPQGAFLRLFSRGKAWGRSKSQRKTLTRQILPCIALYRALTGSGFSQGAAYAAVQQYMQEVVAAKQHVSMVRMERVPGFYFLYSRIFRRVMRTADQWEKPCSVCGEMAADGLAVPLLLGMGLRKFSVSPRSLLRVRKLISLCDIRECRALARRVLSLPGTEDILVELNCSLPRGYAEWLR